MKAIIIGAGIGGLAAATALKQAGIECVVYEAIKESKPVGAAISIWPNGVKCLRHLGLGDILETYGGNMRAIAYLSHQDGSELTRFSLEPLVARVQHPPYPIARSELQHAMLAHWGRDSVHFDHRVTHYTQDETGVMAWFENGASAKGDILIAADGSRSSLRTQVLNFTPTRRYAGYVNWNGLVEIDPLIAATDTWTTYVGEGKRVSLMPISGNRFYFFFDVPLPAGLEQNRDSLREDLYSYFSGWAPQVQRLISKISPQQTNRIEIHDIDPFAQLVNGRVALLGDAAHCTTPDIGQGGSAALEDAVVLGQLFQQYPDDNCEAIFGRYEKARQNRVSDLVLKARKRCDMTHGKNWQATAAWYQQLRAETGDHIIQGLCQTIEGGPLG
jgi:FAD-dependent urate hydroxylase